MQGQLSARMRSALKTAEGHAEGFLVCDQRTGEALRRRALASLAWGAFPGGRYRITSAGRRFMGDHRVYNVEQARVLAQREEYLHRANERRWPGTVAYEASCLASSGQYVEALAMFRDEDGDEA